MESQGDGIVQRREEGVCKREEKRNGNDEEDWEEVCKSARTSGSELT